MVLNSKRMLATLHSSVWLGGLNPPHNLYLIMVNAILYTLTVR